MNNEDLMIQIKGLTYAYELEHVLVDINFAIKKGSFLGIIGPNGSGKSTLLKLILGLLKVQKGQISLFGEDISQFKKWYKIGYVSQKANSFNTGFPATVFEVVKSGLTQKIGLFHRMSKGQEKKVYDAIESVGLTPFIKRNIGELSGGQQQRVFIARALVSDPELLILDEPTVGVDAENVKTFYRILMDLNKNLGITLVLVTHDIEMISNKLTDVIYLNKKILFSGNASEFTELNKSGIASFMGFEPYMLNNTEKKSGVQQHGGYQS